MIVLRPAQLVLQTALPELTRLAAWVEAVAGEADLTAETVFALQLCLEEAVANIVMHGGASPAAPITVALAPGDGEVVAVVEDEAPAFDPTALPPREPPKSLDEARIGELGVHLMRQYASHMHYERRNGRNKLTLRFATPLPSARPA